MFARLSTWLVLSAVLCVTASAQSVDEIIERNIQANGGLQNLNSVNSLRMTGKMRLTLISGIELPIIIEQKRPNRWRMEFNVFGTTIVETFDGVQIGVVTPTGNFLSEKELASFSAEDYADFDGPLIHYRTKGNKVEYVGEESVNGVKAHKLKVTLKNDHVQYIYLDKKTYLEVRITSKQNESGAEYEINLGDYKRVGGLILPHTIDYKGDPLMQKITIGHVEINPKIEDSRFVVTSRQKTDLNVIERTPPKVGSKIDSLRLLTGLFDGIRMIQKDTRQSVDQAINELKKMLPEWKDLSDPSGEALTLLLIGQAYEGLGNGTKALEFYEQARSVSKTRPIVPINRDGNELLNIFFKMLSPDLIDEASLYLIGSLRDHMGDKDGALSSYEEALKLTRNAHLEFAEAAVLYGKANIYYDLGHTQEAFDTFYEALELSRTTKFAPMEDNALTAIGRFYEDIGEEQKALNFYSAALAVSKRIDRNREASDLRDIGWVYHGLAKKLLDNIEEKPRATKYLNQSLYFFREALRLSRGQNDATGKASAIKGIGQVYLLLGFPNTAISYFNKALSVQRLAADRSSQTSTLISKGRSLVSRDATSAIKAFSEALFLKKQKRDPVSEAIIFNNIGLAYKQQKKFGRALEFHTKALALHDRIGDYAGLAVTRANLSKVYRELGNLAEARTQIEIAIAFIETLRSNIANPDLRASYFATVQDYYDFYIDLLMQTREHDGSLGQDAIPLRISERVRARSLLEAITSASTHVDKPTDLRLVARQDELRRKLNSIAGQPAAKESDKHKVQEINEELESVLIEIQRVQDQICQQNPACAPSSSLILSLDEISRQLLDNNTILLEYKIGKEHSYLWTATTEAIRSYELPNRLAIETLARRFHDLLLEENDTDVIEMSKIASRLSEMILGPAALQLGHKRLVIVADGVLQYIPFAALPEPVLSNRSAGTVEPLIAQHEIVSLPSMSVLALLRRRADSSKPAAKDLIAFAEPVFDSNDAQVKALFPQNRVISEEKPPMEVGRPNERLINPARTTQHAQEDLRPLPGTRKEVEEILALIPAARARKVLGFEATRELVLSGVLSEYRYVHFATHSLIDGVHPELSAIVLSLVDNKGNPQDGYLRAHELYNLDLHAELVVLSACKTALGKEIRGEGLVSLTRAFMYAGTPRVVASLWRVDDDSPAELMKFFYEGLIKEGKRPAEALRAAQFRMFKNERWHAPHYWAAFVFQGDWR